MAENNDYSWEDNFPVEDYPEDDDREERSRAGQLQGVCKDCGNGTLNNDLNTAFKCNEDDALVCTNCGGTHLDLL